jgi:hypothetical protein
MLASRSTNFYDFVKLHKRTLFAAGLSTLDVPLDAPRCASMRRRDDVTEMILIVVLCPTEPDTSVGGGAAHQPRSRMSDSSPWTDASPIAETRLKLSRTHRWVVEQDWPRWHGFIVRSQGIRLDQAH